MAMVAHHLGHLPRNPLQSSGNIKKVQICKYLVGKSGRRTFEEHFVRVIILDNVAHIRLQRLESFGHPSTVRGALKK
jgi:hypothetical protein